jgi:outer membrane protein OmpA-like peptidoglycan-associated protein
MIRILTFLTALVAGGLGAAPARALELTLPANARLTAERNSVLDSYAMPIEAYGARILPARTIEGKVRRAAWRIASPGLTTLQVLAPLRAQIIAAGYTVALDCDQISCGGFDFRFATEVLPAPNMYVNIRAFRFLSAFTGTTDAPEQVVTLMVSTSDTVAHVQVVQAGSISSEDGVQASGAVPVATQPGEAVVLPTVPVTALIARGSMVLNDLEFATGTSDLGEGPFAVLGDLAALLKERPDIRLALVGHTDSVGGLSGNIALSKRRAQSVRQRLIDTHGVDPSRLDAEGMGYLSPAASHLTPEGREANRRVEVIVLPAQ